MKCVIIQNRNHRKAGDVKDKLDDGVFKVKKQRRDRQIEHKYTEKEKETDEETDEQTGD